MTSDRLHVILLEPRARRAKRVRALLEEHGHSVSVATTPAEFFTQLAQHQPAIAVLDILDNTVDEVVAVRKIREIEKSLALVLLASPAKRVSARVFQFAASEGIVISRSIESLPAAVKQSREVLEIVRGILRLGDTALDTNELVLLGPDREIRIQRSTGNRDLTVRRIRRGSFEGVPELIAAIEDHVDQSNQNPHVFVWTASAESIMAKIAKCKEALDALH